MAAPGVFITTRCKDGIYTPFAAVGSKYRVLQNIEMSLILEALVSEGDIRIHTAGSLQDGRKVWMLGRLHGRTKEAAPKDIVDYNVLLVNSHDGSLVISLLLTLIRVVCMNTLIAALASGRSNGKMITIRHSGNPLQRITEAQRVLGLLEETANAQDTLIDTLVSIDMDKRKVIEGFERLYPNPDDERSATRAENIREKLMDIYENSPTIAMPGVTGTGWGFVNTITQAVDHGLLRNYTKADACLTSAWFGSGDDLKNSALHVVQELSGISFLNA